MPTDCCVGSLTCQNGLNDDIRLSWSDSGDFLYLGIIILNIRNWLLPSFKILRVTLRQFHTNILESFIVLKVELKVDIQYLYSEACSYIITYN